MTTPPAPPPPSLWRPTRRRLADTLSAAVAPVAAVGLALGGLTAWATAGKAGSPPRIAVSNGRVFLPYGNNRDTAAFFDVTNGGGADDRLVKATSSAASGELALGRPRMVGGSAASRADVPSTTVPAGGTLAMSPGGLDVTLTAKDPLRAGDLVSFTLHFEHSGAVRTLAVVVRPTS
ncbi:copper chaperone PCu(A)C [Streptomyces sp. NPDC002677]|uniref:copper chaperone PCu(A)C n=1 Tax=Streptomyces sp. NPDC002677 TaxID=3154774 RepID=UPI003319F1A7